MLFLELGPAKLQLNSDQLALQDPDQEVAAAAGGLEKAGVDSLGLVLDKVKHGFDHPVRREDFAVVSNTLLRPHDVHRFEPVAALLSGLLEPRDSR